MSQDEVCDWAWHPDYGFGIPGCLRCCMGGMVFGQVSGNIAKASDKEKNPHGYMKVKRNNDSGVAVMKVHTTLAWDFLHTSVMSVVMSQSSLALADCDD